MHASVTPVRVRQFSPDLTVDISRVVGYRATINGEPAGPVRQSVRAAREDLRAFARGRVPDGES